MTIPGVVVDARGEPIAGARVVLRRGDDVIAETVTTGDGAFAFHSVCSGGDLPLLVALEAPGMAQSTGWWRATSGPMRVVMADAGALAGRVVDASGTALGGVEVTARHAGDWGDRQSTRTASDGTFRFDAIAIGRTTVMAFLDGYQLAVLEHRAGEGLPPEIRLGPATGRSFCFRIVGATPEQLAAASCFLYDTNLELPDSCCRGRPDASGVWRVRGLPTDHTYTSLQVTIPGAQCEPRHEWCPAHPESGGYEFEFTVRPIVTRTLRGRLRREDGTPLAGAALDVRANFGGDQTVVTDAEGRFEASTGAWDGDIVGFECAAPELVLDGPGLPDWVSPKARNVHRVQLPCDGEIVLTALRAASVRVVCTHPDGAPAVAAFVVVEIPWQAPVGAITSQLATGVTDAQGVVQCSGLHPQPGAVIFASAAGDGWWARSADAHLVAGGLVELRVAAPATGVVTGLARDANGRALAGEPIAVYSDLARDPDWPVTVTTTDRDGRFRFATLASGTYTFGPTRPDRMPRWRSTPFAVVAGATLQQDAAAGGAAS